MNICIEEGCKAQHLHHNTEFPYSKAATVFTRWESAKEISVTIFSGEIQTTMRSDSICAKLFRWLNTNFFNDEWCKPFIWIFTFIRQALKRRPSVFCSKIINLGMNSSMLLPSIFIYFYISKRHLLVKGPPNKAEKLSSRSGNFCCVLTSNGQMM